MGSLSVNIITARILTHDGRQAAARFCDQRSDTESDWRSVLRATASAPSRGLAARTMPTVVAARVVLEAFDVESWRLTEVVDGLDDTSFARPSPCVPWTAGELLFHVQLTMERLGGMLAAPEPDGSGLVDAPRYYRADQRFSAAVNDDRVSSARRGAAGLSGAGERARAFRDARDHAWALVTAAPPGRVVRTRHGDRMLLAEFLRTRVLELAVHGLDLAVAVDRAPWMTEPAALVTSDLLLAPSDAARLRTAAGWAPVTLIAKLTGRAPLTAGEADLAASLGVRWLALG
jgi:uncharacterized protein (TIGR03083 family)